MANPVTDPLSGDTADNPWQPDADTADTNLPQDGDRAAYTATTALPGNLRRIKSEVRKLSLQAGWINYKGCADTAYCPSPDGPTWASSSSFSLPGDWIASPAIAIVGRMVRCTLSDGTYQTAAILTASATGGLTIITLSGSICGNSADDLADVEFSAVIPGDNRNVFFTPALVNDTNLVLPVQYGGTGTTTGAVAANVEMGGDVSGDAGNATVAKIRGVSVFNPSIPSVRNVLARTSDDTQEWVNANLRSILDIGGVFAQGSPGKGFLRLPLSRPDWDASLYIAWMEVDNPNNTSLDFGEWTDIPLLWADIDNGFEWYPGGNTTDLEQDGNNYTPANSPWMVFPYVISRAPAAGLEPGNFSVAQIKSFNSASVTVMLRNEGGNVGQSISQVATGSQFPRVGVIGIGIGKTKVGDLAV